MDKNIIIEKTIKDYQAQIDFLTNNSNISVYEAKERLNELLMLTGLCSYFRHIYGHDCYNWIRKYVEYDPDDVYAYRTPSQSHTIEGIIQSLQFRLNILKQELQ